MSTASEFVAIIWQAFAVAAALTVVASIARTGRK